jgi:PAS domain S-box-containing protein
MKPGMKIIVLLSLVLAFSCFGLLSLSGYRNFQHGLQISRESSATFRVLGSLDQLLVDMKDLETGYCSYLVSGKESSLKPYHQAIDNYQKDLYILKGSIAADTLSLSGMRDLENLAARKLALAKNIVDAHHGSSPSANQLNLVEQGKKIMDSIGIFMDLMVATERGHKQRLDRLADETNRKEENFLLVCICIVCLFFAAFYFVAAKIISDRKKVKSTAKETEEKFTKLFENNLLPMMICQKETLQFLDVNAAAMTQYGYAKQEFLSLHVKDIQPEQTRELLFGKYKYMAVPDKNTLAARHKKKDGAFLDVQIACCDVVFRGSNASLMLTNDITAMLKTQEENKRLATVLDNTSDFVTLTDLEQKPIFANKAARKVLEYENAADISKNELSDWTNAKSKAYFPENIFPVDLVQGVWRGEGVWFDTEQKKIPVSQVVLVEKPSNGMSGFIASISRDISDAKSKQVEIEKMNEQLRALAASLQNIREQENSKIARLIHDDLGQQLTAIKIDVSSIAKKTDGNKEVAEKINNIILMLNETIKSIRRIATALRPSILDDLGLIEALKWQVEEFQKEYGIAIHFACEIQKLELAPAFATGLFRIFQEAFTNITRHANATRVDISLQMRGQELVLRIQDNGRGFEVDQSGTKWALGLLAMKERALVMGGRVEINSTKGQGVIVAIHVPLINQE